MAKRILNDHFSRQAKAKGYVARSALKLLEIQQHFRIVKPGAQVLDLGCSPGAWLQVVCQSLGNRDGFVLGLDIQPCEVPKTFCDHRRSCTTHAQEELRLGGREFCFRGGIL
ncbi:hypothetical protein WJX75_005154 [Coccomyxa subellipsoidea]|uniref:rRNA methyltransferase 2, mitochondrial n=1 Tax=Coccomyxa subellipsoidea TaxID=248742 RepID=A0ABR2YJD7_9CHLO